MWRSVPACRPAVDTLNLCTRSSFRGLRDFRTVHCQWAARCFGHESDQCAQEPELPHVPFPGSTVTHAGRCTRRPACSVATALGHHRSARSSAVQLPQPGACDRPPPARGVRCTGRCPADRRRRAGGERDIINFLRREPDVSERTTAWAPPGTAGSCSVSLHNYPRTILDLSLTCRTLRGDSVSPDHQPSGPPPSAVG